MAWADQVNGTICRTMELLGWRGVGVVVTGGMFHSAVSPYRFKFDKNVASRFGLVVIKGLGW